MNDTRDYRQMVIAAHLHHRGLSQREVADQLRMSTASVSRLLKRASQFLELRYNFPGVSPIEAELIARFALRDAVVVETGTEEMATELVGQAAAGYFLKHAKRRAGIGVSCGETLRAFLMALPNRMPHVLDVSQLSVEGDPETVDQSPATLVGMLKAKARPESKVYGLQLPPADIVPAAAVFRAQLAASKTLKTLKGRALRAHFVFLGVGVPWLKHRTAVPQAFLSLAWRVLGRERFDALIKRYCVVGEINNQLYDREGCNVTERFPGLSEQFINVLALEDLKAMSKPPTEHRIVAVAAGQHKSRALHVAAASGMVNTLVVGREIAEDLLAFDPVAERQGP